MTKNKLEELVCPNCNISLIKEADSLNCKKCKGRYPIKEKIPRFVNEIKGINKESSERFGYKWQKNKVINDYYKNNFLDEIKPLNRNFFKNKIILDAGCGIGIPTYCMYKMGAKKICSADISSSVEIVESNIKNNPGIIVQADIYKMPFKKESFDLVVCVAVLQHLPEKNKAVEELLSFVKPGGALILWVYGKEGTQIVRWFIEPFRKLISRKLPIKITEMISIPLGVIFHILSQFVKITKIKFPMREYFIYRAEFPIKNNLEMVFDQLLAPLSHFFSKEEFEFFFKDNNLKEYLIRRHNNNSWTGIGYKRL